MPKEISAEKRITEVIDDGEEKEITVDVAGNAAQKDATEVAHDVKEKITVETTEKPVEEIAAKDFAPPTVEKATAPAHQQKTKPANEQPVKCITKPATTNPPRKPTTTTDDSKSLPRPFLGPYKKRDPNSKRPVFDLHDPKEVPQTAEEKARIHASLMKFQEAAFAEQRLTPEERAEKERLRKEASDRKDKELNPSGGQWGIWERREQVADTKGEEN